MHLKILYYILYGGTWSIPHLSLFFVNTLCLYLFNNWGFIQLEKNKDLYVWIINQNNTKKSQFQHMQDQALNWHYPSLCVYNTKLIWYFKFLLVVAFTLKSPWEHKTFIEWVRCVTAYGRVIAWEPGFSINIFFQEILLKTMKFKLSKTPWESSEKHRSIAVLVVGK